MIVLIILVTALRVAKGFTTFKILQLPVLLLVLNLGLLKTDLVLLLTIDLIHSESLSILADDLESVFLSWNWSKFPLLHLALGVAVHLGDNSAISIVSDNLYISLFVLFVKAKAVVIVV